jgi:superfamily I DNA and RNA helicase
MPLQVLPNDSSAKADPAIRAILEHLESHQDTLELTDAVAFYNFPLFREEEQLLVAELVVMSPMHGVVLISTNDHTSFQGEDYAAATERLEGAFSQIFSRLVKYPKLRAGRAKLLFPVEAFLWAQEGVIRDNLRIGLSEIDKYFEAARKDTEPLDLPVFEELISVLDGSKALIRPKERKTDGFAPQSRIAIITRLEEEIRKFDRDQRVAYMTEVGGPQRVRGLAGSGKTVVLALKAALTAVREPEARIAVTFYTKSLYQHIKQLITRFYRLHEDRDPDWTKLQVLHAWDGASIDGLYYLAARRFGHQPMSYGKAAAMSPDHP